MAVLRDNVTTNVLRMIFTLANTKTKTYNLADPATGLTLAAVQAVMNNMITNEVVLVNNVEATAFKDAYIYQTNKIDLA